jgi:DNA polymerase III epsilon subunit-like protein
MFWRRWFGRRARAPIPPSLPPLYERIEPPQPGDRFVALDFETTGLDARTARVIEIGAIRFDPDQTEHTAFCTLVNPGVIVPAVITRITGLTQADIDASEMTPEVAFRTLHRFIGALPVLAYNAPFDVKFLLAEYDRLGLSHAVRFVDVLDLARRNLTLRSYKLAAVAAHLGVSIVPTHRALDDAQTALLVYFALGARPGFTG